MAPQHVLVQDLPAPRRTTYRVDALLLVLDRAQVAERRWVAGMNEAAVRQIAQSNPVPNLSARWTDATVRARHAIEDATVCLRQIDDLADQLAAHNVTVSVDLGPIGNAAAAARRDLEKRNGRPTFRMPEHNQTAT